MRTRRSGSIACAALAALLAFASAAEAGMGSGIALGLNYASLGDIDVGNSETTYEKRTGSHFGFYFQSALGPLGVRAGAIYLNAGPLFEGLADDLDGSPYFDDSFDVRFFVVPVDLQFRIAAPMLSPYVLVGPEMRFNTTDAGAFEDNFRSVVWGGNVGIGVELELPFLGLSIAPELRYAFDLTDLTEETIEIGEASYDLTDPYRAGMYHLRVHVGF